MEKTPRIKVKSYGISLNNVLFENKEKPTNNIQPKVLCEDIINVVNQSAENIRLRFIRNVGLIPESFFFIQVSIDVIVMFDKDAKTFFAEDNNRIEVFLNKNKVKIIEDLPVINKASAIISQLTAYIGLNPVITSPSFVPKVQAEQQSRR
jgi:hypothetical protein